MQVIALTNQKGGVGKTTCAINIGAGLNKLNKRVLLIDLDPQAHLTYSLGIPAHELKNTVYELLNGTISLKETIIERNGLSLVPSSLNLSGAEIEFSGLAGREFLLKETMEGFKEFDYMFIDCPPSLGLLTLNALTTAQEVYIPLQTEFLALQGMTKLLETIKIVKKRLNKDLEVTGIIAMRFDNRKNLNREVVEKIKEYFGNKLFNTLIRDNISLAEAPSFGKTIFEYKSNSYGSKDYLDLCKEIIKRG
ncbi:chromosome partitioning protein ParA [Candidatus Atribacteria bacterium HGW-Atribacteria-1]|nr:MAG: chromosome partitioning protein ParA [Candidatus Atribacteria bacterium HGW-Atribacteria-1]